MNDRIESVTPIPPACPWWCTDNRPEHRNEYESVVDDGRPRPSDDPLTVYVRAHAHNFGGGSVGVFAEEANLGGVVTLEQPVIAIYEDPVKDAETARQMARDLAAAADLLERIAAAETS